MPSSEARIAANQRNARRSTGPKTAEGKEKSRRNALKHGLTGAGVVLPEADAAEVERRTAAFAEELLPMGEIERALVRRAALNSVRMERGADQQAAALSERVRQVEAEFVPPEGVDADEAARLKAEAARRAMFDPSREATLARKYEAAAERGFYRALKELRQMDRALQAAAPAADLEAARAMMGSYSGSGMTDAEFDTLYEELNIPMPLQSARSSHLPASRSGIDLPITVGRPR